MEQNRRRERKCSAPPRGHLRSNLLLLRNVLQRSFALLLSYYGDSANGLHQGEDRDRVPRGDTVLILQYLYLWPLTPLLLSIVCVTERILVFSFCFSFIILCFSSLPSFLFTLTFCFTPSPSSCIYIPQR